MALVVLKVFSDLQEAQVAAGALSAAGLHPSIPDAQVGSTYWILQQGIGGLRLCVPEDELEAAATTLHEALAAASADDTTPYVVDRAPLWPLRTAGALGLALIGSAPGGWLFVRPRGRRGAAAVILGLLALAYLVAILIFSERTLRSG